MQTKWVFNDGNVLYSITRHTVGACCHDEPCLLCDVITVLVSMPPVIAFYMYLNPSLERVLIFVTAFYKVLLLCTVCVLVAVNTLFVYLA